VGAFGAGCCNGTLASVFLEKILHLLNDIGESFGELFGESYTTFILVKKRIKTKAYGIFGELFGESFGGC
jgi:hypothetical protein